MPKRGAMNKRGVSPLIATVLIIGFVVALGVIVTLFLKSQVESILEKQPDCGPADVLNTDLSVTCEQIADNECKVTFINNGGDKIDLARVVIDEESPPATFINVDSGEEFSVTYQIGCSSGTNIRAFPGKVVEEEGGAKAVLCTDLEVSASCS